MNGLIGSVFTRTARWGDELAINTNQNGQAMVTIYRPKGDVVATVPVDITELADALAPYRTPAKTDLELLFEHVAEINAWLDKSNAGYIDDCHDNAMRI